MMIRKASGNRRQDMFKSSLDEKVDFLGIKLAIISNSEPNLEVRYAVKRILENYHGNMLSKFALQGAIILMRLDECSDMPVSEYLAGKNYRYSPQAKTYAKHRA